MQTFVLDGHRFVADSCIGGVLVDPVLPVAHGGSKLAARERAAWLGRPFVVTFSADAWSKQYLTLDETRERWLDDGGMHWMTSLPDPTIYETRCFDGADWKHAGCRGVFKSLPKALACARAESGTA